MRGKLRNRRITRAPRDRDVTLPALDFFAKLREYVGKRARGQNAPFAAIDCLEAAVSLSFDDGLRREREIFERCAVSPEARALRHVFFAEKAAAKIDGLPEGARPKPVTRVGVIGCRYDGSRHQHRAARSRFRRAAR